MAEGEQKGARPPVRIIAFQRIDTSNLQFYEMTFKSARKKTRASCPLPPPTVKRELNKGHRDVGAGKGTLLVG